MRIAILANSLPPAAIGGAEIQAHATAIRLAARGHEVRVFARALPGDPPGAVEEHGVLWVRTAVPRVPGLSFAAHVLAHRSAWRRHGGPDCDVILAYQLVIPGVLGARSAAADRPLVSWVRSEVEIDFPRHAKYRRLSPWVLDRSRRVIVQSESLLGTLRDRMGSLRDPAAAAALDERTRVLANAVALGPEPTYEDRAGLVYLGRLVGWKGVEVLLTALRRLPSPPPLRVLGEGELRADLEAAAAGLPVTFEGAVASADIPGRLAGARVLVAPSWTEGFPNAVLEGMERGVPAVATRVGGMPDLVTSGTNGILVEPGDVDALAAGIAELLADDTRWNMLARAARRTAEGYGWEAHLDALEAILADALG